MKNIEETRTEIMKFRCTRKEREKIEKLSKELDLSVSNYIRAKTTKDYKTIHRKRDSDVTECLTKQDALLEELRRHYKKGCLDEETKNIINLLQKENEKIWQIYM